MISIFRLQFWWGSNCSKCPCSKSKYQQFCFFRLEWTHSVTGTPQIQKNTNCSKRFVAASEEEREKFIEERENLNTKRKMMSSIKIFRQYLATIKSEFRELETIQQIFARVLCRDQKRNKWGWMQWISPRQSWWVSSNDKKIPQTTKISLWYFTIRRV